MPKRVLDGEGYWTSSKIRQLPFEYRKDYAVWIPLAAANGVFEVDLDSIKAKVYQAGIDPDMTTEGVYRILKAFVVVGLVRVWKAQGKLLGYFNGIEKPGRLPGLKYLERCPELLPNAPDRILAKKEQIRLLDDAMAYISVQNRQISLHDISKSVQSENDNANKTDTLTGVSLNESH